MVHHMKTTIEISDALFAAAKDEAARRRVSLRSLVEAGLREVLRRDGHSDEFALPDASVGGGWLQPEFDGASWEEILDVAYRGRGA